MSGHRVSASSGAWGLADSTPATGPFDHVVRRLLVATADLASVTAWSSYDLDHHDRARQLWLVALEASRAADEPDLTATVLRHLAHQAIHLRQPREALQYLRVAHAVASDTRRDRCGAVLAETTIYEAWAHAATGPTPRLGTLPAADAPSP